MKHITLSNFIKKLQFLSRLFLTNRYHASHCSNRYNYNSSSHFNLILSGYLDPKLTLTLFDFGIDGCKVVQLSCRGGVGKSVWSLLLLFSLCVYIVLFSEMGKPKKGVKNVQTGMFTKLFYHLPFSIIIFLKSKIFLRMFGLV